MCWSVRVVVQVLTASGCLKIGIIAQRLVRQVGYARVSTDGQSLDQQFAVLREAGCEVVFGEKISSTVPAHKRQQLQVALSTLKTGDTLVISKLDRLGRTQSEVVARLASLQERGVFVRTLDGLLNTASLGKMAPLVVGLLTGLAEVERADKREDEGVCGAPAEDWRKAGGQTASPRGQAGLGPAAERGGEELPRGGRGLWRINCHCP